MQKENSAKGYFTAIEQNNIEKIKELISNDINPNVVNKELVTPMDLAIKLNRWEIIRELAENNAKVYCDCLHNKYEEI